MLEKVKEAGALLRAKVQLPADFRADQPAALRRALDDVQCAENTRRARQRGQGGRHGDRGGRHLAQRLQIAQQQRGARQIAVGRLRGRQPVGQLLFQCPIVVQEAAKNATIVLRGELV